jgi:hypothetical protein
LRFCVGSISTSKIHRTNSKGLLRASSRCTRASIDGGRDAIGRYVLGLDDDLVYVEFALEAKCYSPGMGGTEVNTVGVREIRA